jgi:hypothetical protein
MYNRKPAVVTWISRIVVALLAATVTSTSIAVANGKFYASASRSVDSLKFQGATSAMPCRLPRKPQRAEAADDHDGEKIHE